MSTPDSGMQQQVEKYGSCVKMFLCHYSTEDDSHLASSLRLQTTVSTGWQSNKHCRYPQELIFHFSGEVQLEFVRLLVHESKIPSSIDVYTAEATEDERESGACGPFTSERFTRLGHVRFATNEDSSFTARELKTIGVHRRCVYLKFAIRAPHTNPYNVFHQVGIMGLNAYGMVVRAMDSWPSTMCSTVLVGEYMEVPLDEMMPSGKVSCTEDVEDGCESTSDPVTQRRLSELRLLKSRAVSEEDYDLAMALKQKITAVEDAGREIIELLQKKMKAVADEDYTTAKKLKSRIDELRAVSYSPAAPTPQVVENASSFSPGLAFAPAAAEATRNSTSGVPSHVPSNRQPAASTAGVSYEDVPVTGKGYYDIGDGNAPEPKQTQAVSRAPAVVLGDNKAAWEVGLNNIIIELSGDQPPATQLVGDTASESKAMQKTFGLYCVSCLFGRRGQLREAAIRAILSPEGFRSLTSHSQSVVEPLLTYFASKGHGVSDPVAGAVFATCEALLMVIQGELPDGPSVTDLHAHWQQLLPELVVRLGDNNNRIRDSVGQVIRLLAASSYGPDRAITLLLMDPEKLAGKATSFRAHISRLELLSFFVDQYGVEVAANAHALDLHALYNQAILPSLQHSNAEVRDAATRLFAQLMLLSPTESAVFFDKVKPAHQALVEHHMQSLRTHNKTGSGSSEPDLDADTVSVSQYDRREKLPSQVVLPVAAPMPKAALPHDELPVGPKRSEHTPSKREKDERWMFTCQFCGEYNPNFTGDNFDIHYVQACPMLCPCPLCDQVTEICTLQQHLVSECEGRYLVRECPICLEAVRAEDIKRHISVKTCIRAVSTHSVCPLCHARFKTGSEGWHKHLATSPGCPNNPRRYDGSGPMVV